MYEAAGVKKWVTEVMIDSFDFIENKVSTGVSISNSTMGNGNVIVNENSNIIKQYVKQKENVYEKF